MYLHPSSSSSSSSKWQAVHQEAEQANKPQGPHVRSTGTAGRRQQAGGAAAGAGTEERMQACQGEEEARA